MSYGGFKCIEFLFYHAQCSGLCAAQRSRKGLGRILDLPIIATRIERSNYPERKRHRPSALCPDTWDTVCTCICWLSVLSKCQLLAPLLTPHTSLTLTRPSVRLHTESLMAHGDSDRDGDYLCWHWTSSHDTALSPLPGLLSSSRDYQDPPSGQPGRHPTLIIALLGFPELQIGQNLMKRLFKIGHWGPGHWS